MEYVHVPVSGGRTMHATVFGPPDGLPAVSLHGLGGTTAQNLPGLIAVAQRYRLRTYAIDLPNHGRSGKVGLLDFDVSHFAALIGEAVSALDIEPKVILGHSFGGQLAAMIALDAPTDSLQLIFINPALGGPWDRKLRQCWRQPWRFLRLIQELGYNDGNVTRGELYHAARLLHSVLDMFGDSDLRPYRRLQATMALLRSRDTDRFLTALTARGMVPIIVQGELDVSTPAGDGAYFVDGFHDWLHEQSGPQALLAALERICPGPVLLPQLGAPGVLNRLTG